MCLTTRKFEPSRPPKNLIHKDFYKIFLKENGKYYSPIVKCNPYILGVTYYSHLVEARLTIDDDTDINCGFHVFPYYEHATCYRNIEFCHNCYVICKVEVADITGMGYTELYCDKNYATVLLPTFVCKQMKIVEELPECA